MASEPRLPTRSSISRQPTRSAISKMLVKSVSGPLAPTNWLAKPFEATEEFAGDETIQALKECLRYPILGFCLLKHGISTVYLCIMSLSLIAITPNEAATVQNYSPSARMVFNLVSAVCHGYATVEIIYQYISRSEHTTQARTRLGMWRQCLDRIQQSRTSSCTQKDIILSGLQSC